MHEVESCPKRETDERTCYRNEKFGGRAWRFSLDPGDAASAAAARRKANLKQIRI